MENRVGGTSSSVATLNLGDELFLCTTYHENRVSCTAFNSSRVSTARFSLLLPPPPLMAFIGASRFSIEGGAHNYVQGDQINNYTTQVVQHQVKKRRIYDEFPNIQRGLVRRLKDLDRKDFLLRRNMNRYEVEFTVERTISTAKIHGDNSTFTVVSYKGQDAEKAWKKEFRQFSETTDTMKMQLFGINRSSVPLLIFYGELVPLAHLWDRLGEYGRCYAYTLAFSMWCCDLSTVWIDPEQGTLICGVEGPSPSSLSHIPVSVKTLPSSVELLQEDVCFRYFSCLPLDKNFDRGIIDALSCGSPVHGGMPPITTQPYVLSCQTNSIIAVRSDDWLAYGRMDLYSDEKLMPDGRKRYTLYDTDEFDEDLQSVNICSYMINPTDSWLLQALSVFHKVRISFNEDLSSYKVIAPDVVLSGPIENSSVKQQRRSEGPPTYFFLDLLLKAGPVVSFHTWSFDENGQTSISHSHCEHLGLPTVLSVKVWSSDTYHWSSTVYKSIHKWQIARGFDPTTTDFARYLEFKSPIYEVLPQSEPGRFEELRIDQPEALSGILPTKESSSQGDRRQYSTETAYNTEGEGAPVNADSPTFASPLHDLRSELEMFTQLKPGAGDNAYEDVDVESEGPTDTAGQHEWPF
ncbi:hypothetical protein E1B28_004945 [Marasmius oreades]|uniref:Uncharacterized protein n=1 Tax=Marasmius oreades TaxID=181124 RepID=A0A9P7UZL3_9AGAR|nr:uncharacterized protein E1B28_004945 [Marasmius oreades]KAG7097611.1 hypothetical protein E1B28_004945 [Marasmius oreades]